MTQYRCGVCGTESKAVARYREDFGEERTCCPRCYASAGESAGRCAVCGAVLADTAEICAACAEEFCREHWQAAADWLKTHDGRLGWFSWADFVLGEVYGIVDCRDEALLLAALAPESESETLAGRPMADLLWAYISADADSFGAFAAWMGACL